MSRELAPHQLSWTHVLAVGLAAISLTEGWPYWCPRCGLPCEVEVSDRNGMSYYCMGPNGRGHRVPE